MTVWMAVDFQWNNLSIHRPVNSQAGDVHNEIQGLRLIGWRTDTYRTSLTQYSQVLTIYLSRVPIGTARCSVPLGLRLLLQVGQMSRKFDHVKYDLSETFDHMSADLPPKTTFWKSTSYRST